MQDRRIKLTATQIIDRLSIDDKTSEPYYRQLVRHIEQLIDTAEVGHGLGLPSERDLADALNLSRTTIKRCYDELKKEGLLKANGRGGTSVNKLPKVDKPILGFVDQMQEARMLANIRMVSLEIVNDETIARIFKKSSDATFMRVVNLRLFDETVIAREVAWYDLSTAPKLLEWDKHGSIHRYLEQVCQIKLIQPEKSIEARLSINPESKIFGFKGHLPCLLMKSRTCNSEGKLIEYVETTFKGDDYKYYVKAEV